MGHSTESRIWMEAAVGVRLRKGHAGGDEFGFRWETGVIQKWRDRSRICVVFDPRLNQPEPDVVVL